MNTVGKLLKGAQSLSIQELQDFARSVNTLYVAKMEEIRLSLDFSKLSFPQFFAAHAEYHGTPAFGFIFEDYTINREGWIKLPKINNPGDAKNHNGVHMEVKYGTIIHAQSGNRKVTWNHVTDSTLATDFLLYAHDYRGDGNMYSFHMPKTVALEMRWKNKNNQITASVSNRKNSKWQKMERYLIGVGTEPIVPDHLTSKNISAKVAA